jgi:hypothetical protein
MTISDQTQTIIQQMGKSIATLYAMRLTSLQILIMIEARYLEGKLGKGKHMFADVLRKNVEEIYDTHHGEAPSRQAFWKAFGSLTRRRLVYIAPHKKGSSKRAVALTAAGIAPFDYPTSIHPYRSDK